MRSKVLLRIVGLAAITLSLGDHNRVKTESRALTITKHSKNGIFKRHKAVKPKKNNYTSKMKQKPNSVRKDFNQRRR